MPLDNTYEIYTEKKFQKTIKKNLPGQLRKVFNRKLNYFKNNLNHPSLNTKPYNVSSKKLKSLGVDEVYEFYINMSIRCVFYVIHEDKQIIIAYVGNHEQVKNKFT